MPLDEAAIEAIYREHGPMLRAMASRITHDPARAEELVQEIVFRVWRRAPEPENLRAYLAACARNILIDEHRARSRRVLTTDDVSDDPRREPAHGDDVDDLLDRLLMAEALSRLRADHRQVVDALYYRHKTIAATAAELHVPEGTVKSRAFYAVRSLRSILDEMGVRP
jgi:RNA polymerase sigma-70 factor, ECF subfamily